MGLTALHKVALLVALPVTGILLYLLLTKTSDEEDEEEEERKGKVVTSRQTVIEVRVPRECAGSIIGPQGSRIKQLQESTGTRVNFKDESPGDTERVIVVRGTAEGAQQAEQAIRKVVAEQPKIYVEEILIPHQATGRIIGKSGDTIRYMSHVSRCKINVDRNNEKRGDGMKRVVLRGTSEAVENAKGLIQEKVAEEEAFRARSAVLAANRQERGSTRRKDGSPAMENSIIEKSAEPAAAESVPQQNGGTPTHRPLGVCAPLQHAASGQEGQWPTHCDYLEVYISAVVSPSQFWVQLLSAKSAQLDRLVEEMTRFYESPSAPQGTVEEVKVGDVIAARFPHDDSWYRARVCEISKDSMDLYYVDFGDNAWVAKSQVRSLRGDFLILPFQAFECCLANIKPNGEEWNDEATDLFEDLTYTAKWKVMMAKTISYHQTERGPIPCVDLIDTNKTEDVNVVKELVKAGYGVAETDDVSNADSPLLETLRSSASAPSPHMTNAVPCLHAEPLGHSAINADQNLKIGELHFSNGADLPGKPQRSKPQRRRKRRRRLERKVVGSDEDDLDEEVSDTWSDCLGVSPKLSGEPLVEESVEVETATVVFSSQEPPLKLENVGDEKTDGKMQITSPVIDIGKGVETLLSKDSDTVLNQPDSSDETQRTETNVLETAKLEKSIVLEHQHLTDNELLSSKPTCDTASSDLKEDHRTDTTSNACCSTQEESMSTPPVALIHPFVVKSEDDSHMRPESGIFMDDSLMAPILGGQFRVVQDGSPHNIHGDLDARPESGIFSDDSMNDVAESEEPLQPVHETYLEASEEVVCASVHSSVGPQSTNTQSLEQPDEEESQRTGNIESGVLPDCTHHNENITETPCASNDTNQSNHFSHDSEASDAHPTPVESEMSVSPEKCTSHAADVQSHLAHEALSSCDNLGTDASVTTLDGHVSAPSHPAEDAQSEDSEIDILRIDSLPVSHTSSSTSSPKLDGFTKRSDMLQPMHVIEEALHDACQSEGLLASFPDTNVPSLSSLASEVCPKTADEVLPDVACSRNDIVDMSVKSVDECIQNDTACSSKPEVPSGGSPDNIHSAQPTVDGSADQDSDVDVLTLENEPDEDDIDEACFETDDAFQAEISRVSEIARAKTGAAFVYSDSDSDDEPVGDHQLPINKIEECDREHLAMSEPTTHTESKMIKVTETSAKGISAENESRKEVLMESMQDITGDVITSEIGDTYLKNKDLSCEKGDILGALDVNPAVIRDEVIVPEVPEATSVADGDGSDKDADLSDDSLSSGQPKPVDANPSSLVSSDQDEDRPVSEPIDERSSHIMECLEDENVVQPASTQEHVKENAVISENVLPSEEMERSVSSGPSTADMSNSDDDIIDVKEEYESLEPLVYDEDAFVVSQIPLDDRGLFYPEWLKSTTTEKPPITKMEQDKWGNEFTGDEHDDSLEISLDNHEGGYPDMADGATEFGLPTRFERASSPFPCAERPLSPFPGGDRAPSPFLSTDFQPSQFPFGRPDVHDAFRTDAEGSDKVDVANVEFGFESDFVPPGLLPSMNDAVGDHSQEQDTESAAIPQKLGASLDSDFDFSEFIDARVNDKQESGDSLNEKQAKSSITVQEDASVDISEDSLLESENHGDSEQVVPEENRSVSLDSKDDGTWVPPTSNSSNANSGSIPESKFLHVKVDWPERHGIIELGSDDKLHSELASSTACCEKYTEAITAPEESPDSTLSKTAFTADLAPDKIKSTSLQKQKPSKNNQKFELRNYDEMPPSRFSSVRDDRDDACDAEADIAEEAGVVNVSRLPCLQLPTTEILSGPASTEIDSLEDGMNDSLEELKDESNRVKELRQSVVAALNQIRKDEEARANYDDDDGDLSCDSLDDVTEACDLRADVTQHVDSSQRPQSPSSMSQDSLCDSQTNEEMTCLTEDDLPPRPSSSLDYYEDTALEESSAFTDDSIEFDDSIFSGSQLDMTIFEMDTTPTSEDDVFGPAPIMGSNFNIMMDTRPVRHDVRPMQVIVEEEEEDEEEADLSSCDSLDDNAAKASSASKLQKKAHTSQPSIIKKSKKEYNYEEDSTAL